MIRITLPPNHNNTTRCYPRTLSDAFQNDISYAQYIESPPETISRSDVITVTISLMLWAWLITLYME